ncbi:MAG: TIR domain-containing protein [Flavobacteriaceae bacterium]|nr:TIR domain-containing protein [Flavobacteriaceae bacterium]
MSAIFISHSSKDNAFCEKLMAWLDGLGHRSVFLDFDAESGIEAGTNWEQKLYRELRSCRAVIVVCSQNLIDSKWCFAEITQARSLGKHIFPLKIAECKIDSVLSDSQIVNFLKLDEKEAFERLKKGLEIAGIDAEDPFDWDGSRPPYPGLLAFQEADAAIFFGRETEIGNGLDVLNSKYRYGGSGLVMTLGASGSGKSSLIRAGIVPRLKRDPERWLVVDPFQPGEQPFMELAKILSVAFQKYGRKKLKAKDLYARLSSHEVIEPRANVSNELAEIEQEVENVHGASEMEELDHAIKSLEGLLENNSIASEKETHKLLLSSLNNLQSKQSKLAAGDSKIETDKNPAKDTEWIAELLDASGREQASLLIIIDQFEELLERPPDHPGSRFLHFLRELMDQENNRLIVLGTMRSDFLGSFQQNQALVGLEFGRILVGPLDAASLVEVIEEPADLAGVKIEPKLLQALIDDAGTDDALPLLAFTLRELYDKFSEDNLLDYREYKEMLGGIQGALSKAAENVLSNPPLSAEQEVHLRQAFLFLARVNEDGNYTREVANWLDMPKPVHDVLKRLVDGRLLVTKGGENGEETIEVAHETLFRSWDRLRNWLDEDREFLLWKRRLNNSKEEWLYSKKDKSALLTGGILSEAMNWHRRYEMQLDAEEQEFILASKKSTAKRNKNRAWLFAGVLIIITSLGALMGVGFYNSNKEYKRAQANYLISEANKIVAADPTVAIRLAEAALQIQPQDPTIIGSTYAIYNDNNFYSLVATDSMSLTSSSFSPDRQHVLTGSLDGSIRLWDLKGNRIQEFIGHDSFISSMTFDPDGKYILTGSWDKTARLWDLQGNTVQEFIGHNLAIFSVAIDPGGTYVLTGSMDSTARLWDLQGNTVQIFEGHDAPVTSMAFDPAGRYVLTGSGDKTARLWDLQGNTLQEFKGHDGGVTYVAFGPDGKYVLTGSEDKTARLWNLDENTFQEFRGHDEGISSMTFDQSGKYVLTGSDDKTARLWDLQGNSIQEFKGHDERVLSVAFGPDGKYILTGSDDKTALLWELQDKSIQVFKGHEGSVKSVAFDPDGKYVLTSSSDKSARLWDLQGTMIQEFIGHTWSVNSMAVDPGGKYLLTGSGDMAARLWDLQGNPIKVFEGHEQSVHSVAFDPEGKYILAGLGKNAHMWDLQGNTIQEFMGHELVVNSAIFDPDGNYVLTGSLDNTARLWDLQGNTLQVFRGHDANVISVAFDPEGKYVLTGSGDKTARLWDLQGNTLQVFKGHDANVSCVTFDPNGKYVLTGSWDNTARLWDLQGNTIQVFKGHSNVVNSVSFDPSGKYVLTGSGDNTALLWDILPVLDKISTANIEPLSPEQKIKYGIE